VNLSEIIVQSRSEVQALNDQITSLQATLDQLQSRRAKLQADITAIGNYIVATGGVLP
jgi:peptidoglycan hydrolase CwlO-like protein